MSNKQDIPKTDVVKTSLLKTNPNNPRVIRDERFFKLVKSIKEFPEMLHIRPIVVDADMVVLGGNMRLKACIEAGMKEVPVLKAENLTKEQQDRFVIADNVNAGEWDFDALANEWEIENLSDWGVDVEYFSKSDDDEEEEKPSKPKTTDDDYSTFELVMLHDNKLRLVRAINSVKSKYGIEKNEDAIMQILQIYFDNEK